MEGFKRSLAGILIGPMCSLWASASVLSLSDLPLTVAGNADPNVVLTLDDTISMQNAYVPKDLNGLPADITQRKKYYRSAAVNSIFYNPELTYLPPYKADGTQEPQANFDKAIRGFYHSSSRSKVTTNLGSNFLAVYKHRWNKPPKFIRNCDGFNCGLQAAHYYIYNRGLLGCSASMSDDACFEKVIVGENSGPIRVRPELGGLQSADERKNFANWYQYYATRIDAAKTALRNALTANNVGSSVRLARQNMHWSQSESAPAVHSGPINKVVKEVAKLDGNERAHLYDWISNTPMGLNTPIADTMLRAGEFFSKSSTYRVDPESRQSPVLSCRSNTHIVVTDGFQFKNPAVNLPAGFKKDEYPILLPDGTLYSPVKNPVYSSQHDIQSVLPSIKNNYSLSDLAFHYWATDLFGDRTDNNVAPYYLDASGSAQDRYWNPVNDPATWQHVNTFVLTFGLGGTLPDTEATYQGLLDGTLNWPAPTEGSATSVDDMYHATINGRGGFYNASNSEELVDAIQNIFSRVAEQQSITDTVTANSGRIGGDSLVYVAGFDTASRSGQLQAFRFSDGSEFGNTGASGCNANPLGTICPNLIWDAAKKNPATGSDSIAHADRNIFTYDNTAAIDARRPSGKGTPFIWSKLNSSQQQLLDSDGLGEHRVNYLRGDISHENAQNGVFRSRIGIDGAAPSQVGAIVHSNPVYVGNGVDANGFKEFAIPDGLEAKSYHSFLRSRTVSQRAEMVYVGANDGMLHGYQAEGVDGGKEVLAYVPDMLIKNLHTYSDPAASYRAYVDGTLSVQDAFINGRWRTMLVGALRTGGQGIYALDITDPEADADDIVHWEFSDQNDADMGYTFGDPLIVKSNYNGGEWVVVMPNGYNSTEQDGRVGSGKSVLYVLALDDGELLAKLDVPGGTTINASGLSSPVGTSDPDIQHFDDSASGVDPDKFSTDYVYAGDLQGKMWKFDLSSADKKQWHAKLLFDAGSSRPITGKPSVGSALRNGAGDNKNYRYVYFGTGKYMESSDRSSDEIQAFYGLIDSDEASCGISGSCISNSSLLSQSIDGNGVASDSSLTANNSGWYLELSSGTGSERVIGQIAVIENLVVFVSLQPTGNACGSSGTSTLYALNRFNGGQTQQQILDLNNDNVINDEDIHNDEVVSKKDIPFTTDMNLFGDLKGKHLGVVTTGESGGITNQLDPPGRDGRVRWRQLK